MAQVLSRWRAGHSDWSPIAPYEIVLERIYSKWHVTYLVHGERHARIGFDTEDEALRNIAWLKTQYPEGASAWIAVTAM
ncbi:hypothetical protein [Saccharopolyspora elongata]|uniref:Uncharacterized protein n=1 Tax=Saccharopolyspora elongata TaxID=2530387 RepID=A0A4R4Y5D1_9PSEU|nr:hypothetical protein [Saccharopolyspora elongata]TDD39608.1 hypothetical protein E1288_36625 [Saccharopolyspora elongata]